ncbi:TetR/AcrR family transcriptional regulator [Bacillus sp. 1P02SD]|uniref:TetR/AcrR family transcriptional regulator n=1 Tax=Bacillus sp. 1P02SD TaxID=3132264 RepID=UPI0039A08D60
MSKEKIKEVAVKHYNEFGYKGTKLSQIAEEVGIRKQSLAYHFPSKQSLFKEVYKEAVEDEIQFVQKYFKQNAEKSVEQQLYQFLTEHKERFITNPSTRFMLMIPLLVPDELYEDIVGKPYIYIDTLTAALETCFTKQTFRKSTKECALAFVTVLDGLDIQLVYEDSERYDLLQNIIWDIFWTGIKR